MSWLDYIRGFFVSPGENRGDSMLALPPPAHQEEQPRQDSVINPLSGLGGSYDMGNAGVVDTGRVALTSEELNVLYTWNGYGRRIVSIFPAYAFRKGWKLDGVDADALKKVEDKLSLRTKAKEAAEKARLFGGAALILATSSAEWETPLSPKERILALIPTDYPELMPLVWNGDPRSPNYARPEVWTYTPIVPTATVSTGTYRIHHSRIIYFDGETATKTRRSQNQGYGESCLQAAWDAVRNLTTIDQAAATQSQQTTVDVMKVSGFANKSVSDQAAAFEARMAAIAKGRSLLNMIVLADGEEYERRLAGSAGFKELAMRAAEALSAATRVPQTILYGQTPSGLNTDGESQRLAWFAEVFDYQTDKLAAPLLELYQKVCRANRLAVPDSLTFLPLEEISEKDQAAIDLTRTNTNVVLLNNGIVSREHVVQSIMPKGFNHLLPTDEVPPEPMGDIPGGNLAISNAPKDSGGNSQQKTAKKQKSLVESTKLAQKKTVEKAPQG